MRGGRFFFFCLLPMVFGGCAALHGPTLSERASENAVFFGQAQELMAESGEKKPDYARAAGVYEQAARNGSAQAAYALAAMYRDSLLVENNEDAAANAFFWMREAAVGGWPQAQYEVAVFYYEGKGVEANSAEGIAWLEKAGGNNHVLAQRFLGALYLDGVNAEGSVTVKPDSKKGALWYLRAAYNDDGPSQAVVGSLYTTGRGVEKDTGQAIKWNRLAAAKGVAGAQIRLANLYTEQKNRRGYEQAILLFRENFAAGNKQAGFNLGRLYYYSPAPYNDVAQAAKLFQATAGSVGSSALMMGVAAEEGKGVPQDFAEAARWYEKALALGQKEAYAYLGSAYLDGRGVPANEKKGLKLLETGAEKGDAVSQRRLAIVCSQGKSLPYDYEKALHWMTEAAQNGDAQAMYLAGAMYEKGIGSGSNLDEARRWYSLAAAFSPQAHEKVREERYASWKRDAQRALDRLGSPATPAGGKRAAQ